jgi:thiamine pyrophosphokinase
MKEYTVIVADGSFPVNEIPLGYLRDSRRIICCDGSADRVIASGYVPDAIIGDMDSLSAVNAARYSDRIFRIGEQETNDLTKSVEWCRSRDLTDLVILGGTGKREDHTLGNISLLAEYAQNVDVRMVTDTGVFIPLLHSSTMESFPGQQVSVFSIDPATEITSSGLRYGMEKRKLENWWCATLNESLGDEFRLEFSQGRLIVYLKFR